MISKISGRPSRKPVDFSQQKQICSFCGKEFQRVDVYLRFCPTAKDAFELSSDFQASGSDFDAQQTQQLSKQHHLCASSAGELGDHESESSLQFP
jgi:hypothetical protein